MKKTYTTPLMRIYHTTTEQILATSQIDQATPSRLIENKTETENWYDNNNNLWGE